MKKQEEKSYNIWFWILLLFIIIILIVIVITDPNEEKKDIEQLLKKFNSRINNIKQTIADKQRQFDIAYKVLKFIFVVGVIIICWVTIYFTKSNDFFDCLGNCTKVFSGLGILLLLICLLNDSEPINIFHLRTFLKNKLEKYYFDPIQHEINSLPALEEGKRDAEEQLLSLNNSKKENKEEQSLDS